MNITINITEPIKRVQEFREYDLGQITTTLQDLLDNSSITIESNIIPILKVLSVDNIIKNYLIKDLTENLYNTQDYITGQDLTEDDLILFVSESQILDLQNKLEDALIIQQSTFMGTAEPAATPTGTGNRYWTAVTPGTYTNFGGFVVPANHFAIFSRDANGVFSVSQTALDLTAKSDRVLISNNDYVNSAIRECYIDKGANTFGIYFSKLFKNSDGICGFELKRADTGVIIKYEQYTNTSLAPRIYNIVISGLNIYLIIDWTKVTFNYDGFTGNSTTALLNANAFILEKNLELSGYKLNLQVSSNAASIATNTTNTASNTASIIGLSAANKQISPVITKGKYVNQGSGALLDEANSYYSDILPVGDGIEYYYTGSVQYSVAAYAYYDANMVIISTFPASSQSSPIVITNQLVTYPANTKYIRFGSYANVLPTITVNNNFSTKAKTAANETAILTKLDRVLVSDNSYINTAVRECYIDKGVNTFDIYFYKLFKNSDGVCGFELKRSDTNGTFVYQDYTTVSLAPKVYYTSILGMKIYIKIDWTKVTYQYTGFTGTIVTGLLNANAYLLEKNTELGIYKANLDITAINNGIASGSGKLVGKKIAFIGDSITEGQGGASPFYGGWAKIIGVKNNMTYSNYGVGGTCITVQGTRTDSIIERITNYSTDFDFVCLQGGLNDTAQIPTRLGTISTGYNATLDNTTFCGAVEYLCKYALKKYAGKKVGFIITYTIGSLEWGTTWAEKMEEIFKKWGMPYLDLRKYAGFNLASPDLNSIYGVTTGGYTEYSTTIGYALNDVRRYNGSAYQANQTIASPAGAFNPTLWTQVFIGTYDTWHCNVKGYDLLAPKIESFLNSL